MGFFNYDKEGPGIDKNAPKKKGIFLFFELLGRKFSKFFQINLLYFFTTLPMIAINFWASNFFVSYGAQLLGKTGTHELYIPFCVFFTVTLTLLVGSGPASSALSNFYKKVIKESGIYLWSDFWDDYKANFKQGMIVSILNTLITYILIFGAMVYFGQYMATKSLLWFFCMILIIILGVIFVSSSFYQYPLMVTFENSIFELYKNSIILSLINTPWNVVIILITLLINGFLFITFSPIIEMFTALVLMLMIYLSVMRFTLEFYSQRFIERTILDKIEKEDK